MILPQFIIKAGNNEYLIINKIKMCLSKTLE